MTGNIVVNRGDSESAIHAINPTSGTIYLYANETNKGIFTSNPIAGSRGVLQILNDNTIRLTATSFFSGANGIDCSVDSQGDGWIRYSNGLQMCWGWLLRTTETVSTINFPKAFIRDAFHQLSVSVTGQSNNIYLSGWNNLSVYIANTNVGDLTYTAVGWWK